MLKRPLESLWRRNIRSLSFSPEKFSELAARASLIALSAGTLAVGGIPSALFSPSLCRLRAIVPHGGIPFMAQDNTFGAQEKGREGKEEEEGNWGHGNERQCMTCSMQGSILRTLCSQYHGTE